MRRGRHHVIVHQVARGAAMAEMAAMAELGTRAQRRLDVLPPSAAWLHQQARQGVNRSMAGALSEHLVARLTLAASRVLPPSVAGVPLVLPRSHALIKP